MGAFADGNTTEHDDARLEAAVRIVADLSHYIVDMNNFECNENIEKK